jgi:hypothetical protein
MSSLSWLFAKVQTGWGLPQQRRAFDTRTSREASALNGY